MNAPLQLDSHFWQSETDIMDFSEDFLNCLKDRNAFLDENYHSLLLLDSVNAPTHMAEATEKSALEPGFWTPGNNLASSDEGYCSLSASPLQEQIIPETVALRFRNGDACFADEQGIFLDISGHQVKERVLMPEMFYHEQCEPFGNEFNAEYTGTEGICNWKDNIQFQGGPHPHAVTPPGSWNSVHSHAQWEAVIIDTTSLRA